MQLPRPGEQFEGYQLGQVLGEGGFAVVFRATELGRARREVAIKVLKPEPNGRYAPDVAARFGRELRMLAQLRSPHSVTLYSHGQTQAGLLYLVFEFVEGHDLDEFARTRRLSADEVLQIIRQLLEALREAHGAGLLHRDIKPQNIRVFDGSEGLSAKLLDFGIAKPVFASEAAQLTRTGEMLGTPRYMSPEQLTEQDLTPASDIYSLGIVAYEMLSGGAMHGGRWSDQLDRLQSGHVFSIPELERVGPAVNQLVMKMSARDLRSRFQTADEVLRELDDLEMGVTAPEQPRPVLPPPRSVAMPPEVQPRRSTLPTPVLAIGGAILLFMIGALIWLIVASGLEPEPEPDAPATAPPTSLVAAPSQEEPPAVEVHDVGEEPATLASPGCGQPAALRGTGELHVTEGLRRDSWVVHVPANYDRDVPHPIVVIFHSDISSPRHIIRLAGLDKLADEHGFVVLAPTDNAPLNIATWQREDSHRHVPIRLLDTAHQLCVDPQRVYLLGHGVGGYAVEHLSCEPWVTAAATNSFRRSALPFCLNARPVPFIHFAPMTSIRIPVEGGTGCHGFTNKPSLEVFEGIWRDRNECGARTQEWDRIGAHVCYAWEGCAAEFVSCHIQGGHGWHGSGVEEPTITANCKDDPPVDFPISETVWKFFKQHARSDEATSLW